MRQLYFVGTFLLSVLVVIEVSNGATTTRITTKKATTSARIITRPTPRTTRKTTPRTVRTTTTAGTTTTPVATAETTVDPITDEVPITTEDNADETTTVIPTTVAMATTVAPVTTTAVPTVEPAKLAAETTVAPTAAKAVPTTTTIGTTLAPINETDLNVTFIGVKGLAATNRTERKIGEACDPLASKSNCGANAYCPAILGCKMGLCTCRPGTRQDRADGINGLWDCARLFALNDSCSPSIDSKRGLFPDGAACDSASKTVVCERAVDNGPCSAKDILPASSQPLFKYSQPCDRKLQQCNSALGHVCILPAGDNTTRCICPSPLRKAADSELCLPVNYGDTCDDKGQCLGDSYSSNSQAIICKMAGTISICTCNADAGFSPVSYTLLYRAMPVKYTRCVPKATPRTKVGENCTVGDQPSESAPLCEDKSQCQRCPEFEASPSIGRCMPISTTTEPPKTSSVSSLSGSLFVILAVTLQLVNFLRS